MIFFGHLLLSSDAGESAVENPGASRSGTQPAGEAVCRLELGTIRVDGGRITEVNPGDRPSHFDVGGSGALICPGFVDAHVHLPQFDVIGAHGMPLLDWLDRIVFPAEMRWSDVDEAAAMTRRVIDQLVSVGTTAIAAYATSHHRSAKAALELATQMGIGGVIGQVLMDRGGPPELCFGCDEMLDQAANLQELYPAGSTMAAALTPRFAIACSEPLLSGVGYLASQSGAVVQTHLAETVTECQRVSELFDGRSYVDVYREAGLLGERSLLGHGIHLDQADRTTLAQTGSIVAHCPTANSFLRSGQCRRETLRRDGVKLALGSDIGAGYERSMVRVARAMIETASAVGDRFPTAAAAWHGITAGNADAIGLDGGGRLRVGGSADVVVAQPDVAWLPGPETEIAGPVDPLSMLMFAWDDRWIQSVWTQGRRRYG